MHKQEPNGLASEVIASAPNCEHWQKKRRSKALLVEHNGSRYFLKRSDGGSQPLRNEAKALRAASAVSENIGVRAAPFVGIDESQDILVTKFAPGVSVFNFLWNCTAIARPWNWRLQPAALDTCWRISIWLHQFHSLHDQLVVPGAPRCEALLHRFESKITHAGEERGGLLNVSLGAELLELANGLLRGGCVVYPDQTLVHGDFTPTNFLVDKLFQVTILDFGDTEIGFAAEDVARLWFAYYEIASSGGPRTSLFGHALRSLEVACARTLEQTPDQLFRFLLLLNASIRLTSYARLAANRPSFRVSLLQRRLARTALRFLERAAAGTWPALPNCY